MSRRKQSEKKLINPDPIYNSILVSKIINNLMKDGKKSLSQKMFYTIMKNLKQIKNEEPIEIIKKSITNITPKVEIKTRRIGGATYQIPTEINETRGKNIAIKILIKSARKRNEKKIIYKLQNEILDAYNNIGNSIKRKEEIHKTAEANKAFSILKL